MTAIPDSIPAHKIASVIRNAGSLKGKKSSRMLIAGKSPDRLLVPGGAISQRCTTGARRVVLHSGGFALQCAALLEPATAESVFRTTGYKN